MLSLCRRSRAVRGGGAHAKRSSAGRPAQFGVSVFREPSPDGHTRVAGVVRPLHRRLSVRPHTRVLFRGLEVGVQADRLQRKQMAHSRRRMEPHVLQLQRDHPHRVSASSRYKNTERLSNNNDVDDNLKKHNNNNCFRPRGSGGLLKNFI